MKKLLSLLLALAMLFTLCVGVMADEPAGELAGEIVILHTNDVHGAIESYAKVAALKLEYEAKGAEVLLMDAGDYIQGEPYVSISQGLDAIRLMEYAYYDVATVGNHEFDYGFENLSELADIAEFPIIAANVMYNGKLAFDANKVFELASGVKIGVFGLTTPETATKAHPGKIKGVTFLAGDDMNKAAQAQVDELTAAGCDYIICLGHLGIDESSKGYRSVDLLEAVTGIDVFIDGHSHSSLDEVKALVGDDCKVGDTLLTSTGTKLATVGVVTISKDGISLGSVDLEKYEKTDDVVEEAAQLVIDEVDAAYGEVFAKSEVELCGEEDPGNRTQETNNGDLIADSMLWYALKQGNLPVADENVVAITNGGGIRAAIAAGDITKKDVNTVLPYGNTVAYVTVKGSVLLEALEASTFCTPNSVGAFPQVAGIKFTVDTNKVFDQGEQYPVSTYYAPASINRVTIDSINGKAFDPDAEYLVVTSDYLAAGGDTYGAFAPYTMVDTGMTMDEALMSYITEELDGVVTAEQYGEPQERITIIEPVFTDVASSQWFFEAVMYVYDNGIMNGMDRSTFAPDGSLTRAMVWTMLARMDGVETEGGDAWYSKAQAWAVENEVSDGTSPDGAITREQLVTMLYRYVQYKGIDVSVGEDTNILSYTDAAEISEYAVSAFQWACGSGLIKGDDNNALTPKADTTRAQAATMFMRLCEDVMSESTLLLLAA